MELKRELTSRERVMEALKHKETDRVPFSLGFGVNLPAKVKLMEYLRLKSIEEVERYLESFSDIRKVFPLYRGPQDRNLLLKNGSFRDIWGIVTKPVSYGEGSYDEISFRPLADIDDASELKKYAWPSADWWDMGMLSAEIGKMNEKGQFAIQFGIFNIFETSWYMRGFEQMFVDLIENKDIAWEIMNSVTDYYISYFTKALQAAEGKIDIAFGGDDIGQQQGLLMSQDLWEEMVKPHHARMNKALHEYGVKIMYHTDGAVMEAVPSLINMGIDILEALQFDARGMDPVGLKEQYGDKLCFHGGVSVQKTLPFGTVEQVREEVGERIRVLGKNGGYILAPSHAIQAGTPPENVIAFLEASGHPYK